MRHSAHFPALDGLRGLAVIAVVLFHADGFLRGGYLGVDVFFVLSGYLITSILLAEQRATGRIDLKAFWVRRARRLFPALLSLMPAIALYGKFLAKRGELPGLRGDTLATLGYVANWRTILAHKSYWQLFAAPSPLAHTWSLSIEEQFYVLWPLLVFAVLIGLRGSLQTLRRLTGLLALGSACALWVLFDPVQTNRAYLGTDTRAAAILCGALLSLSLSADSRLFGRKQHALDLGGLIALAVLAVLCCTLDGQSRLLYRGGFWLS
ncbi:MAG TPA: acyltransferase, partial [Polyangiaceae bacterium]